ncbi:MAG: hypothetical protein IKW99_03590 [Bacteroidales bacterium]|nr:hypothetical protein [Bacteroidales bacterium]
MKLKSALIILSAVTMTVISSCHKGDDGSGGLPYLDGSISFDMPLFVSQGQQFTLTPKGVSNPTGDLGYYWFSSWDSTKDTVKTETGSGDGSWTVTVPESTGTYTITAGAYAEDYYGSTYAKDFTVVDASLNGSITGAGYQADSAKLVDPRDGGIYYLATSGGNVWMQNNLYYSGAGFSYENSPAMDRVVGRLYSWNEAMTACPEGWHLPSDADFAALVEASVGRGDIFAGAAGSIMSDVYFNGIKMWTFWPDVKITNKAKFSAIPIGYAINQEGIRKFVGTNEYAAFWTSDENGENGLYRYIFVSKTDIFCSSGDKGSFLASVRCVKD